MIGSMVIEDMINKGFEVLVYDPFLSDEKANKMGAVKASSKTFSVNVR